ncbi:hypothetical protein [Streptomyces scopuliridis]|uniref:CchlP n=1 Tax=Streptomyces scopuliridis RB72 TaxID=1440053 RepID=A0A2T7SNI5_9ACTN|nr:hypothetical protein [Streptomyces scopuliridis]PVE04344.1 hypothetical protein Y717_12610 [Streptomyces scopuliridis RB72]
MEVELAALATSGATTVVALMATEGWNAVRSRVAALLQRGSRAQEDPNRVEGELELERREVADRDGDDAAVIADLEAVWRIRLRQLLREDPSASAALRELIAENSPARGAVHNTISGGGFQQGVIQTGSIHGDVHLG